MAGYWCFTSSGFLDTVTLATTGTYRIIVNPVGGGIGSLTFTLHTVPADVTDTIVVNGPSKVLTVTTPGQNGLLTFSGAASQQVTLTMSNGSMTACTGVSILNPAPDNTALAGYWCYTSGGVLGPVTLPTAGTYRITLNPEGAGIGSMTFTVVSP